MRRFGITAIFPGRNLSKACKHHKKYPYLLRHKVIRYPNQVWSTDITYIKLPSGNVYLMAIIDWFSRKVLSWQDYDIQISMDGKDRARFHQSLDYNVPDEMYKCFQYNELDGKKVA